MNRIHLIETFDGKTHRTEKEALRHLDELKGKHLTSLAHRIAASNWKFNTVLAILEEPQTLETFRQLLRIEEDMQATHEED